MFTYAGQRPKLRKKTRRLKSKKVSIKMLIIRSPHPFHSRDREKNLVSLSDGSYQQTLVNSFVKVSVESVQMIGNL